MTTVRKDHQPKALYLLNFISMWECFSYYGMRVLLVLFMTNELRYSDTHAFCVYALYTTLVEFGGIIGGVVADRMLGFRRSIALGGITIALGHICMTFPDSQSLLFAGLGLIVAGTSLFRSNVAAFLGQFYEENDPRRDAGYTLYYTGINLGGFLAAIACGVVAEVYGWHAGFGLAAVGMMLGNIALYFGRGLLKNTAIVPQEERKGGVGAGVVAVAIVAGLVAVGLSYSEWTTTFFPFAAIAVMVYLFREIRQMTSVEIQSFCRLGVFVGFLILFFACEEQLGSSLVLFSERHVERQTAWGLIPAASLVTFNPLTILLVGPLFSRLLQRYPLEPLTKISLSFALLGSAFYVLYGGVFAASQNNEVSLIVAVGSICLISLGELLIGPTVYAMASSMAPRKLQGLIMGTVTLGFSMANLLSGVLSHMMVVGEGEHSLAVYSEGFGTIGFCSLALAVIILLFNYRRKVLV